MPLFNSSRDVVRIQLTDENEWIEVKAKMSPADRRRAMQNLIRGQRPDQLANGLASLDAAALMENVPFATLSVVIQGWHILDADTGEPAPLNDENLRCLSDEDLAIVNARLNELYPKPFTAEQAKN